VGGGTGSGSSSSSGEDSSGEGQGQAASDRPGAPGPPTLSTARRAEFQRAVFGTDDPKEMQALVQEAERKVARQVRCERGRWAMGWRLTLTWRTSACTRVPVPALVPVPVTVIVHVPMCMCMVETGCVCWYSGTFVCSLPPPLPPPPPHTYTLTPPSSHEHTYARVACPRCRGAGCQGEGAASVEQRHHPHVLSICGLHHLVGTDRPAAVRDMLPAPLLAPFFAPYPPPPRPPSLPPFLAPPCSFPVIAPPITVGGCPYPCGLAFCRGMGR
jgi:hypothetical protein